MLPCEYKLRFENRDDAEREASKATDLYRTDLRPYYCDLHLCWHIGRRLETKLRDLERHFASRRP